MMPSCGFVLISAFLMSVVWLECCAREFTFELPDNEKMCFYEVLKKEVKCTLEFQVSLKSATSQLVTRSSRHTVMSSRGQLATTNK